MATFELGDSVVIVSDRKLRGRVEHGDFAHVRPLEFIPQSFRGQKGWVSRVSYREPDSYRVYFSLQRSPRMVLVRTFEGDDCKWPVATEELVKSGFSCLALKADELVHDAEPEGDYDYLPFGDDDLDGYEGCAIRVLRNAYWFLQAREATRHPERYVAGLREHSPQMSVEEIHRSLKLLIAEWRRFQEDFFPSVQEYIRDYVARTRLDWRHVLGAVEQAEQGDSRAFTALIRGIPGPGNYSIIYNFLPIAECCLPVCWKDG